MSRYDSHLSYLIWCSDIWPTWRPNAISNVINTLAIMPSTGFARVSTTFKEITKIGFKGPCVCNVDKCEHHKNQPKSCPKACKKDGETLPVPVRVLEHHFRGPIQAVQNGTKRYKTVQPGLRVRARAHTCANKVKHTKEHTKYMEKHTESAKSREMHTRSGLWQHSKISSKHWFLVESLTNPIPSSKNCLTSGCMARRPVAHPTVGAPVNITYLRAIPRYIFLHYWLRRLVDKSTKSVKQENIPWNGAQVGDIY